MKRTLLTITALSASLLAFSQTANAEDISFAYHPTELRSAEGQQALRARIRSTARQACRGSSWFTGARSACRDDIEAQLITAIESHDSAQTADLAFLGS